MILGFAEKKKQPSFRTELARNQQCLKQATLGKKGSWTGTSLLPCREGSRVTFDKRVPPCRTRRPFLHMLTAEACKRGPEEGISAVEPPFNSTQMTSPWDYQPSLSPPCLLSLPQMSLLISSFVKWLQRDGTGRTISLNTPRFREGRKAADSFLQASGHSHSGGVEFASLSRL